MFNTNVEIHVVYGRRLISENVSTMMFDEAGDIRDQYMKSVTFS